MEHIKEEIKSRIIEPFPKSIDCGDGWMPLIAELHEALLEVDPHYRVYQVKEKFGKLCFYYAISNPELFAKVKDLVKLYEDMSSSICEKTGKAGKLMVRNGYYKTLHESFKDDGWEEVGDPRQ